MSCDPATTLQCQRHKQMISTQLRLLTSEALKVAILFVKTLCFVNATSKRIKQHGALRGLLPRVAYATLHFTAGMPRLFGPSFDSAMMNHKTFLFFLTAQRGLS
jgi:hypothetical protein